MSNELTSIVVIGARTFFGTELIKRLEEDGACERIIAADIRPPDVALERTVYQSIDLTSSQTTATLTDLLRDAAPDVVVHASFLSRPTHAAQWAHEVEAVGTSHVLDACETVAPKRLIVTSTTLVYGPSPSNPAYLSEEAPLRGIPGSRSINDRVAVENQLAAFAARNPDTAVCSLRYAPVVGPTIINFFTEFLSRPVAPKLLGHDPLIQLCHEYDAIAALERCLTSDVRGPLNIAAPGVLPYSTLLAMIGRLPLPIWAGLARPLAQLGWTSQVGRTPPAWTDLLRYSIVADTARARRELDFEPRFDIRRTLLDFLDLLPDELGYDYVSVSG